MPLTEQAVLTKLARIRPLRDDERQAVRDLYAAPRRELVDFGYLFPDLDAAWDHLVAEPDEDARWCWFRERFALFHARCGVIARHLARHVLSLDGGDPDDEPDGTPDQLPATEETARRLLRILLADENAAAPGPWERDDGHRPAVTWGPAPVGGAYAAITGLVGTGLLAEHRQAGAAAPIWRELQPTTALFGPVRDAWNAPAPTLLPALDADLPAAQQRWAGVRNGIVVAGRTAHLLGGAEAFAGHWSGLLLVEQGGGYTFWGSGAPPEAPGRAPWRTAHPAAGAPATENQATANPATANPRAGTGGCGSAAARSSGRCSATTGTGNRTAPAPPPSRCAAASTNSPSTSSATHPATTNSTTPAR